MAAGIILFIISNPNLEKFRITKNLIGKKCGYLDMEQCTAVYRNKQTGKLAYFI